MNKRKKRVVELPCKLREIRKSQGKSMMQLSRETGIPLDQIGYIERKQGEGQPSTHLKLAKALKVSLDDYFGFDFLETASLKEPKVISSDSIASIEELLAVSDPEILIKRILLQPKKDFALSHHVKAKKAAFFYLAQGEAKIWLGAKEYLVKPGDYLGISSIMGKVRIENVSGLPLSLLMVQW